MRSSTNVFDTARRDRVGDGCIERGHPRRGVGRCRRGGTVSRSAAATSAAPSRRPWQRSAQRRPASASAEPQAASAGGAAVKATPGQSVKMMLLPKFLGILPFDQANKGAMEAASRAARTPRSSSFVGPTAENSVQGQIEFMTNAPTQGMKVVMLSNNAGDQIAPAAEAAQKAGTKVVTWDSPIPSAKGETVFVAQVDFNSIGTVMADMALSTHRARTAASSPILSASPDAANQNAWIEALKKRSKDPKYAKLKLVDTVYGDDQSEKSYNQALALVDKYPD